MSERLDIPLTDEDQRIMSRMPLGARMEYMVGDARADETMQRIERLRESTASSRRRYLASIGMKGEQREAFWVQSDSGASR